MVLMEPVLIAPSWWMSSSGLTLPSSIRDSVTAPPPLDLPPELIPTPAPVAFHRPVDASDQLHAFIDEEAIGLPRTPQNELRDIVEGTWGMRNCYGRGIVARRGNRDSKWRPDLDLRHF